MRLKQAALAHRLGVTKGAISRSVQRGRLILDAEGLIDTENTVNAAYLAKFSAHRGKSRADVVVSPSRSAAQRVRAVAQYHRLAARYARRLTEYAPVLMIRAAESGFRDGLISALKTLPDAVDLGREDLERALEETVSAALREGKAAALRALGDARAEVTAIYGGGERPELPADACLDDARVAIDLIAAQRHHLETGIDTGELIPREEALRAFSRLDAEAATPWRSFPRRVVAQVIAARATGGEDAARTLLRELVAKDVYRLKESHK